MANNFYELTYIVNPVLEDEQVKETVSKFTAILEDNGAQIEETDEWGIQRLAYDIDGKGSGYYVNAYFTAPGPAIAKLERAFQIDDNILRFITLKYDAKMLRHRELKKKGELPLVFEEKPEVEE